MQMNILLYYHRLRWPSWIRLSNETNESGGGRIPLAARGLKRDVDLTQKKIYYVIFFTNFYMNLTIFFFE